MGRYSNPEIENRVARARADGWKILAFIGCKVHGQDLLAVLAEPGIERLLVLFLVGHRLTTLPAEIGRLTALRVLELSDNSLTALPAEIGQLTALTDLHLGNNQLTTLPAEIGQLSALTRLYLTGNQLSAVPAEIGQLTALEVLDLGDNPLTALPDGIAVLSEDLALKLSAGSLNAGQRAAFEEGGWKSLRKFLAEMAAAAAAQQSVAFCSGKLLLVGEAENGKTCLQEALRGLAPRKGNASTHGMGRELLTLKTSGELVASKQRMRSPHAADWVDLQVWDMGGQEFYKHSHQMFFTPGAIYLAVFRPRGGDSVNRLKGWLELVQARTGGQAIVLVIATHADEPDARFDETVSKAALTAQFPCGIIQDVMQVDSFTGRGIPELRRRLAGLAAGSQAFKQQWPPAWSAVLDAQARRSEPYLQWADWEVMCKEAPGDAEKIARAGHLTGMLLWRKELSQGAGLVVLKPDWLSRAVARILQDETAKRNYGLVKLDHLQKIWGQGDGEDGPAYPPETHPLLIALIEANELGYRPKGPADMPATELLLTQMVTAERPAEVNEMWEKAAEGDAVEETQVFAFRKKDKNQNGRVLYLIYLLIFRLRRLAVSTASAQSLHWQTGLLVKDEIDGLGLIELEGDELRVRVRGVNPASLLATINYAIGEDHDQLWEGLAKTVYLVCGDHCPKKTGQKGRFERKLCINAMQKKVPALPCLIATCGEFVEVEKLLRAPRRSRGVEEVATRLDLLWAGMQRTERMLDARSSQMMEMIKVVRGDIRDFRSVFEMEVNQVLRAMADEGRQGPRLFSVMVLEPGFWRKPGWLGATLQVTLWCEHSLRPLPQVQPGCGTQEIFIPKDTLVTLARWLKYSVRTAIAVHVLGVAGAATGAFKLPELVTAAAREWEPVMEMAKAMEELGDGDAGLDKHALARQADTFGATMDRDMRVALILRDLYAQKDPHWAGMKCRFTSERGWMWMHPKYVKEYDP